MGVGGQRHVPAALPWGKTQCMLCRRLGGPQGQSGQVRKIWPSPGFDPRTAQPTPPPKHLQHFWSSRSRQAVIMFGDVMTPSFSRMVR